MPTFVGLIHLKLHIAQAMSLKDKRRVLKSFKDRIANGFRVSVAEVEGQNAHKWAVLAIAMVGSDKRRVESALQKIVNAASSHRDMVVVDYEIEWL